MKVASGMMAWMMMLAVANGQGLGRAALPEARSDSFFGGGTWGIKAGLGWAVADWEFGNADGASGAFTPQVSLFYKAADFLDVNLSGLFLTVDDSGDVYGDTEATMVRLALGMRGWFNTGTRLVPYLGVGIGYYILDSDADNARVSVDDAPGAFLEGGLTFQVMDNFFVGAEVSYDFLLGSANARVNGMSDDFDVTALTIGLTATLMY